MGDIQKEDCWLILMAPQALVIFINLIGLIPIAVVVILYGSILYRALKTVGEIKRTRNDPNGSSNDFKFFNGEQANFSARFVWLMGRIL